jgi:hypothetical protein
MDVHAEHHGLGTRFCFQQEEVHRGYLLWFHNYLAKARKKKYLI